jgi:hypothetical protein
MSLDIDLRLIGVRNFALITNLALAANIIDLPE